MKRVVLYTKSKCPHCVSAKKYLDQQRIKYRQCDVTSQEGKKEFGRTGLFSVPALKVGDMMVKGFSIESFNALYHSDA